MNALEKVLREATSELPVLRKHGATDIAVAIERLIREVRQAARPVLEWLTEQEAMLQSGKSQAWLRQRFAAWEEQGFARREGRMRYYLRIVIPVPVDLEAVRADARRTAHEEL